MRPILLLRTLIATKLGACAFCIRLSLTLSVLSWLLLIVVKALIPGSLAAKLALVPALAFATLFASHLVAYAVRVVLAYRQAGQVGPEGPAASAPNRRRFLVLSARTIGLALVPTVLVATLWGSAGASAGRAECPRPTDCLSGCCCQRCKTRLKKCDPAYLSCSYICWGSRAG